VAALGPVRDLRGIISTRRLAHRITSTPGPARLLAIGWPVALLRHGRASRMESAAQGARPLSRESTIDIDIGKRKSEFEAWQVVKQFDASPMESRNGCDDAEPEAISGRATTPFDPIKPLENV